MPELMYVRRRGFPLLLLLLLALLAFPRPVCGSIPHARMPQVTRLSVPTPTPSLGRRALRTADPPTEMRVVEFKKCVIDFVSASGSKDDGAFVKWKKYTQYFLVKNIDPDLKCGGSRIDIIGIYKTPEGAGVRATIAIGSHKPDGEGTGDDDDAEKALRKVFNDNEAQASYLTGLKAADPWGPLSDASAVILTVPFQQMLALNTFYEYEASTQKIEKLLIGSGSGILSGSIVSWVATLIAGTAFLMYVIGKNYNEDDDDSDSTGSKNSSSSSSNGRNKKRKKQKNRDVSSSDSDSDSSDDRKRTHKSRRNSSSDIRRSKMNSKRNERKKKPEKNRKRKSRDNSSSDSDSDSDSSDDRKHTHKNRRNSASDIRRSKMNSKRNKRKEKTEKNRKRKQKSRKDSSSDSSR